MKETKKDYVENAMMENMKSNKMLIILDYTNGEVIITLSEANAEAQVEAWEVANPGVSIEWMAWDGVVRFSNGV